MISQFIYETLLLFMNEVIVYFLYSDRTNRKRRSTACVTSVDCDEGDMCNMDWGEDGAFCEYCPDDCIAAGFNNPLGTFECQTVCFSQESENNISNMISNIISSMPTQG